MVRTFNIATVIMSSPLGVSGDYIQNQNSHPHLTVERIPPSPHTSVAKGDQVGNLGFYFHLAVMRCSPSPARWRQRKPAKTEDFIKNPKTHNEIRKYPVLNRKSLIVPKAR